MADTIRRRNVPAATDKGVALEVAGDFETGLDSYRGSLLCLIATNLVQNESPQPLRGAAWMLCCAIRKVRFCSLWSDQGSGISEDVKPHLFEPGHSGRVAGTGIGLAISKLLARQIGASLVLVDTNAHGTTFRLTLPRNTQTQRVD